MGKAKRRAGIFSAIVALVLASFPTFAAKPIVHLIAPSSESMGSFDPLVADTALRLVSAEMAARYGIFAKFWAAEQSEKAFDGQYPRVLIKASSSESGPYARMTRKGNVFAFYTSPDGQQWRCIGERRFLLPTDSLVGLYAPVSAGNSAVSVYFEGPLLNGSPFAPTDSVDLGVQAAPSTVHQKADRWDVETKGRGEDRSRMPIGRFIYGSVTGDFDFQIKGGPISQDQSGSYVALMCRGRIDKDAPCIEAAAFVDGAGFGIYNGALDDWEWGADMSSHVLTATLETGPGETCTIAVQEVSLRDWKGITGAAQALALKIEAAFEEKLGLDFRSPKQVVGVDEAQKQLLSDAHARALQGLPSDCYVASKIVDTVLNATPLSAEAHREAAFCAAAAACVELYGFFSDRPRYLAVPLSEWLLAEKMAASDNPHDKLIGGWVALACGYPSDALALAGGEQTSSGDPERNAFRMFITRDYRLLAGNILAASPMEQLAYRGALEECERYDLLQEWPGVLAVHRWNCCMLPLAIESTGIGSEHTNSALGVPLAFLESSRLLLLCDDIPAETRQKFRDERAELLVALSKKADVAHDEDAYGDMMNSFYSSRVGRDISALEDLFSKTASLSSGPCADEKLSWQSLPIHELAKLQRGILLRTIQIRATFLGERYGVADMASQFCNQVAGGFERDEKFSRLLRAFASSYVGRNDEAGRYLTPVIESEAMRIPGMAYPVVQHVSQDVWDAKARAESKPGRGRGSWDWQLLGLSPGRERDSSRGMLTGVDGFVKTALLSRIFYTNDPAEEETLAREGFHLGLCTDAADRYEGIQPEKAISMYKKIVELVPNDTAGYTPLALLYRRLGKDDLAIDVAKEAQAKCQDTVSLCWLLSCATRWLGEAKRLKETLEMGEAAARAYSYDGLVALAYAQELNGLKEQTLETLDATAARYEEGVGMLIRFLIRNNYPKDEILRKIRQAEENHDTARNIVTKAAEVGIALGGGGIELFDDARKQNLIQPSENEQISHRIICLMNDRRYDEALVTYDELIKQKKGDIISHLLAYAAKKLKKDPDTRAIEARIARFRTTGYKVPAAFVLGRLSMEEAEKRDDEWFHRVVMHWWCGVKAETDGDIKTAIAEYESAYAWGQLPFALSGTSLRWIMDLEAQTAKEDVPAQ